MLCYASGWVPRSVVQLIWIPENGASLCLKKCFHKVSWHISHMVMYRNSHLPSTPSKPSRLISSQFPVHIYFTLGKTNSNPNLNKKYKCNNKRKWNGINSYRIHLLLPQIRPHHFPKFWCTSTSRLILKKELKSKYNI